jgi:hypothetical protein
MSDISRRSCSCKSFYLARRAAALVILIFTPAHAEKSAENCTTERIVNHDGWGRCAVNQECVAGRSGG